MTPEPRPHAVLFDFDGTLGYYLPSHLELYVRAASEHGVVVTAEALAKAVDSAWAPWETQLGVDHSAHSSDEAAFNAIRALLHRGRYQAAGVQADEATLEAISTQLCTLECEPVHFALYEDTIPALEQLREAGVPAYIVSNHIWRLPEIIDALGLGPYVRSTLTSARVGYRKPHPEIFRVAAAMAGAEPAQLLYVGDNVAHDVEGALAAGMRALLIDRMDKSKRPDAIRTLLEVPL